jgi:hypothetical protein
MENNYHPLYMDFLENESDMGKVECRECEKRFTPNQGAFTVHAYYVPTSDICADCLDARNFRPAPILVRERR